MIEFPFLQVDRFLATELAATALGAALAMGVIDKLLAGPLPLDALPIRDRDGRRLLLNLLGSNDVLEERDGRVTLTDRFRTVLQFRDLLEAKLSFAAWVADDVRNLFPALLDDLPTFMKQSKTFNLFRYDRCLQVTPENVDFARKWVSFTTVLTRYESAAVLRHLDLAGVHRLLDVGGNSGEFALRLCRAHHNLHAEVFDLPVVCAIGREHVRATPEAARITFHAGDMRQDPLPAGADLVTFKSVLHDWPEPDARRLLGKAAAAVRPGGRVAVFERARMDVPPGGLSYAMIPNIVFFRFFRGPELYVSELEQLGFRDIRLMTVPLEMPFLLVVGTRPA